MRKTLLLVTAMFFLLLTTFAQNRQVSGRVTDTNGQPLQGVTVTAGVRSTTTTNANGEYNLNVPAGAKRLQFTSAEWIAQTAALNGQSSYNIRLMPSNNRLQDVVVVAYGTQRKATVTGSNTAVAGKEIENKPFTSVDKALQGEVAGLQSSASSGAPGSAQDIIIRGQSSLTAGNGPLWVIDGVISNTGDASRLTTTGNLLATLNPNDVESINVLKDASSTALYGSRGANGVILVTTKKGKSGKTKFRFDTEVGQNSTAYYGANARPLNAQEFLDLTAEGLANAGFSQAVIDGYLPTLGKGNGVDYNWRDAVTRKGTQQQYNLSASGGTDKTTFYMSGGYFKQDGTVIGSDLERFNGAIRLTNQATDRLNLSFNLDGGSTRQNTPLNGGAFGNPALSSYFLLPTTSAYNKDGSLNYLSPDFPVGGLFNSVATTALDTRLLKELSFRGSLAADYKIMKNLTFRSVFGADYNTLEENQYNNPFYGDGAVYDKTTASYNPGVIYGGGSGRAYAYYTRYMNYTFTNTLNYRQALNKDGDIYANLKVGYENQLSKAYGTSLQGTGFPLTSAVQLPAVASTPKTASAFTSDYTFVSQFALLDLNYKDKYVATASFRRDGSSRFSPSKKYGNFYSVGAAWNINKESFLESVSSINLLKVRASYGKTGNANIGNYDYLYAYGFGANYNGNPGSFPAQLGNDSLSWENNKQFDLGLDLSIIKNRIGITVDYYNRKSTDLLLQVPLSTTSGFQSQIKNTGSLQNKGIELTINLVPVRTKNFSWLVDFNYSHNQNKITSLPSGSDIGNGLFLYRVGYDAQSYYLRNYAGVDPANGDPLWYTDSTKKGTQNVYSTAQRLISGSASPKSFGSLSTTLNYKGFSVQAQLYYNYGNYSYDAFNAYYLAAGFGPTFNKVSRILDRWQKPGDITYIPKYIYNGNKGFNNASTFYENGGDYIRLRNIQLGYSVPASVLGSKGISSLFFYVRGTNLFTWVSDKNLPFDPEQGFASRSNLNVFIPKTIAVGLNLGF